MNFIERADFAINRGGEMGKISQKNHNNPFHGKNGWLIFFKQIFFAKLRKKHIELIGR